MRKPYPDRSLTALLIKYDTSQSGGLVALHQACQMLRSEEATVALAGASQLLLSPDQSVAMS